MEPTQQQLDRLKSDWEKFAKEPVEIRYVGGTFYAFGSELATLRLHYAYRYSDKDKVTFGFSKNMEAWFFSLDTEFEKIMIYGLGDNEKVRMSKQLCAEGRFDEAFKMAESIAIPSISVKCCLLVTEYEQSVKKNA